MGENSGDLLNFFSLDAMGTRGGWELGLFPFPVLIYLCIQLYVCISKNRFSNNEEIFKRLTRVDIVNNSNLSILHQ